MQDSKQKIIDAAFRLFSKHGMDGTTTKEIAETAGVNEVTIFRNFGTKEALFKASVVQMLPVGDIRKGVHFDSEGSLDDLMVKNAKTVLRIISSNRYPLQLMVGELWRHPELSEQVLKDVMEPMIDFLAENFGQLIEKGRMRQADPKVAARTWIGLVQSYFIFNYLLRASPPTAQQEDMALKGMVDIFLNGMRGEAE
jgi:AcrR family transcriptional regulator